MTPIPTTALCSTRTVRPGSTCRTTVIFCKARLTAHSTLLNKSVIYSNVHFQSLLKECQTK
jgi:hypothetical protein